MGKRWLTEVCAGGNKYLDRRYGNGYWISSDWHMSNGLEGAQSRDHSIDIVSELLLDGYKTANFR